MYNKGDIVTGVVTGISDYGVFIKLEDGYTGMIHISEVSLNFVNDINDYFNVGDKIKSTILEVDDENKHLKLSIKNRDFKYSKNDKKGIKEEGLGFSLLEDNLKKWIDDYS